MAINNTSINLSRHQFIVLWVLPTEQFTPADNRRPNRNNIWCVRCSCVDSRYVILLLLPYDCDYYLSSMASLMILNYAFWVFCDWVDLVLLLLSSLNASAPGQYLLNIGLNMLPSDSFMSCLDFYWDILQGSSRRCNWLSFRCLVPWINHVSLVCWSTFWKSSLKW